MTQIIEANAFNWLPGKNLASIVTSLPDAEELGLDFDKWEHWFKFAATLCMEATAPNGYCIFYQTDRKHKGGLLSKPYLLMQAAEDRGWKLIWHKIALKVPVGHTNLYRPGYTHLMCFTKQGKVGVATPDVFDAGRMVYKNAAGLKACEVALNFLKGQKVNAITDPFCGQGSIVAVAASLGFDATGVDIDPEQCAKARQLVLNPPLL